MPTVDRATSLDKLKADWETLARHQHYWAKGGGRQAGEWDEERFLAVGRAEVADVLATVARLFPATGWDAALDFGCGVGRLTAALADRYAHVTGLDISEEQIRRATERVRRDHVTFAVNARPDLADLPDDSVDLAYAHVVFQHMRPELARGYLAEFYRVLRPGGCAVFTEPSTARLTAGGIAYQVLPKAAVNALKLRRDGLLMEMNPIPHDQLSDYLVRLGFLPPVLQPSASAGPNWWAFRYFAQKPGAQT